MKCPVCRAPYRPANREPEATPQTLPCRRCGADLTRLIQLYDRAIWHYRQAIAAQQAQDYSTAQAAVQRAIALHHADADFHALAGQIYALQGQFGAAIAAWKQSQSLDPAHPIASPCLTLVQNIQAS